ncbi:MAG: hypothetical protein WBJ42_04125 [Thermovirgaceae bacterium]
MRSRPFFFALIVVVAFTLRGTAHGQDIPALLSRTLDEAPSLQALGLGKGTVVLRDINYRLLADGKTERTTTLFLYEGENLPDNWRNWEIPIPEGGEASVLESALYDPYSRRVRFPLIPREVERGGVRMIEVRLPNDFEGNILALSYREALPTRMNLEDAVPIDLDLAQWEQKITLAVPSGVEPAWLGEDLPEPHVSRDGAEDVYSWSIINTPAYEGASLSPGKGRWLVFSLRKGIQYSLSDVAVLAASRDAPPPPRVASLLKDPDRSRRGIGIMEYMNDPDRVDRSLPPDLVRAAAGTPAEGPWTEWEASFLLGDWLRKAGWGVATCWDPRVPLPDGSPATVKAWGKPVLSVKPADGKPFMFEIGQAVKPGSMPPRLWGRTLHYLDGGTPSRMVLPSGGPGDHRLSINWAIEVAPDGMATGDLTVTAGGAWVEVLAGGGAAGKDAAVRMLASFSWPSTPGVSLQEVTVERPGTALRVKVPIHTRIAIPGGEGLLLRMPSVVMPWQRSVAEKRVAGDIRFPFVFEQTAAIVLPEGFKVMVLPVTRPYDAGQVKLEESIRVKKERTLAAEQKTVVSTAKLEEQAQQALANVVRQQIGWNEATVPLKKR